ncbi:MAG TPA: Calx-beta domain-containing protein, partial [Pyrinomonadaceae bacterium]|nr:Calx-beta domain-containing protein [Pyrinomonadaceae bacterium]
TPVFVGSEPNKLALSDDGRTAWVTLDGANAIRRYDIQTQTPGLQFPFGPQRPFDIEVMPGSPQTLVVTDGSPNVSVYDDGVKRPSTGLGLSVGVGPIEFGASPSVLYGYNSQSSSFGLMKYTINANGATNVSTSTGLLNGFTDGFEFAAGRIYSAGGRVVDPEARTLVGTFNQFGSAIAVDHALGRAFFVNNSNSGIGNDYVLTAYDINTFLPLGSMTIPGVGGTPLSLVRWGANGLAFRATGSSFGQPIAGQVFIVQSALVSPSAPVPTGFQFSADQYNISEGVPTLTVTVLRTGDVSQTQTVNYATSDGTAQAVTDYVAASGTLTFAPNERSKTFTVEIVNDNVYEGATSEAFNVTLSGPSGGAVVAGTGSALITVSDFDPKPAFSIADIAVRETDSGTAEAVFTLRLSNPSVEAISAGFATADGTAAAGSDYVAATGTVSLPPLTTTATFKVLVNGDTAVEPDETFFVNLVNLVNVGGGSDLQARATITNDDGPGVLQFSAPTFSFAENSGTANITVTRTNGASNAVTVNYATADGSARAGSDYVAASGTLTFAHGETSKTIAVQLTDDAESEANETVALSLSAPTGGATLGAPTTATLFITNDDFSSLRLDRFSYTASEGDRKAVVKVLREGSTGAPASVEYITEDGDASQRFDYNLTLGTLRFEPGEREKTVTVILTDDVYDEPNEQFVFILFSPQGASLVNSNFAVVTINDNDTATLPSPVKDPTFSSEFFVRQHYVDFFNREPDAPGLAFWKGQIDECESRPEAERERCRDLRRVNVSAAFFQS